MILHFFVSGEPATKGSYRAFRNGGFVNANPKTKDWEMRVAHECQERVFEDNWPPVMEKAVSVECRFYLPRPKSMSKKVVHHIKRPDIDKLMRAVLDGITGIAIKDDSQVSQLCGSKEYADGPMPVGVDVFITTL